jgi:site-specific DNA-cytosine methylase
MNVVGLLAGVGTLLHEARSAGFNVVGNIEARASFLTIPDVWHANFPGRPLIRPIASASEISNDWYEPDLVLGHPPCGAHSILGVAHSLDMDPDRRRQLAERRSKRVGLLPMFAEYVNRLQPKIFALDNLPKILKTVAPSAWWEQAMPDYRFTYIIIKNWDYGTPQIRERLWVVGTRRPLRRFTFTPPRTRLEGPRTAWRAIRDLPWEPWVDLPDLAHVHAAPLDKPSGSYPTLDQPPRYTQSQAELALRYLALPPMYCWPYRTRTTDRITKKLGRVRLRFDGHSRVISGGTLQHPLTGWVLTARERARIMDWPDEFVLWNGTRRFDRTYQNRLQLFTGKAVPSRFPRYLIPQLIKHLRRG